LETNDVQLKLGQVLKLERERQKIALPDLAENLKIKEDHLSAIERGALEDLPAALYFSLFAKAYAEAIGVDYNATLQAIQEDVESAAESETDADAEREAELEEKRRLGKYGFRKKLILIFGGMVGLFVIFLVLMNLLFDSPAPGTTGKSETETASQDVTTNGFSTAELAGYKFDTPPSAEPEEITLTLIASEESWATVLSDGDTAIFRSLVPGREYRVTAKNRLTISIAHPTRVTTRLNGTVVSLRDEESRRISRVIVDQVNLKSILENPGELEPSPRRAQPASLPGSSTQSDGTDAWKRIETASDSMNRSGGTQ
jgi:cytoskeletal protein RodZ